MQNRRWVPRVTIVLLSVGMFVGASVAQGQTVVDSINGSGTPDGSGQWSAYTYGIDYTPSSSYTVARIEANWGGVLADGRTITVEVYDENPNSGGVLLASGSFPQTAAGWQGANLDTPLSFQAGEDYFIGFSNTLGAMGRFYTDDDSGTFFTAWWGNAASVYDHEDNDGDYNTPIVRFIGNAAALPGLSPLGIVLMVVALAAIALVVLRRV